MTTTEATDPVSDALNDLTNGTLAPGRISVSRADAFDRSADVDHPMHYGGEDNPYEAIKVIQAWELDFELGSVLKYVARAGKKQGEDALTDLNKAARYLQFEIDKLSR
jgi:hypothetical protein